MCQTDNSEKKIAKKDIVCYKLLIKNEKGKLVTFYREYPVKIGQTYKSRIKFENDVITQALHALTTESACKDMKKRVSGEWEVIIAKCMIPAGSIFYTGGFDLLYPFRNVSESYKSICSNKMKIVEIVKP